MTGSELPDTPGTDAEEEKWPIGFMIIVVLAALYLLWRAIQAVGWLIEAIT